MIILYTYYYKLNTIYYNIKYINNFKKDSLNLNT